MALSGPVSKTGNVTGSQHPAPGMECGAFWWGEEKRKLNPARSEFIAESQFVPKLCDLGAAYQ